ncbi:MAG: class I SAM-dependent methyltransferase [Anaerolineae bacterium]|nr:class I SAM-dependent methyltransferase [Anaerolineae bacterium]
MGRWSGEVASRFLAWMPQGENRRWLDIGCGTGALTRRIISTAQPQMMVGIDPSLDFVGYARQQTSGAHFLVADAGGLALQDKIVDTVVSGLALNFMPHPERALLEMRRVVKPGGVVAAYVWDYAGKMEFLRYFWDAAVELDPHAAALHEGHRFPICQPELLRRLWEGTGFQNIAVDALDIPTPFDSFESYWQPFTRGSFPAPKYALSLNEMQRNNLREHLRAAVPTASDGTINLIARAWAVRGYTA